MGSSQNCMLCLRTIKVAIFWMLLLVSSFGREYFMAAEGRAVPKLLEAAQKKRKGLEDEEMMRNKEIGSRPPRCERRCSSCAECEAVQVPITAQPQNQNHRRSHFSSLTVTVAYSGRKDDISNYKPMSWKCKCGNFLFNP